MHFFRWNLNLTICLAASAKVNVSRFHDGRFIPTVTWKSQPLRALAHYNLLTISSTDGGRHEEASTCYRCSCRAGRLACARRRHGGAGLQGAAAASADL